jgi:hypothetical protein
MRLAATTRRLATWIAALAILMAALAPALSHALGAQQAASWIEICSAQGSKWLPVDDDGSSKPKAAHAFEHCPYCTVHAQGLGLPPVVPAVAHPAGLHDIAPQAFLAAPRTLHAWVSAQPRAPPLFS